MADTNLMESNGGPESVFRSVADAEVSLDEMLSLACRQGKQDIVELLLESGAKVNYRNKAGNTPLLEACSQGHVNIACLLLERNADIDAPTETTSDSALTWACTLGNEEIVQLLLEHKASIEHRTRDGCTALMFAALAGHENVARLLLDHGAKLNVESDSNKDSPLTFACWKGHQRVVELFLAHKASIEHRTKEGFSPLMFAALGGHTEVARLLLEKKAEVNNPSGSNNDIPLTSACWKGHHAVVELLLQYNSNIEHHTKDGCTPLMLAAREGHLSVAQLLLNHNAKVNVPSGSENNIPLTLACWKGHRDVVELLLQYNSNIEHQNKAGCTPLMLAAREGHFEATDLLLDCHAQLNVPSGSNDDTPLTLACWKGHEGVVGLLLEKQSSINHQTKTGCTPLMEATREGHVGVARMLLEAGADVETPDNYGQTPFFMACWKGHAEVASLLLEYGANKDCRTKTGITPFFQACRENHVEVVKLLLDYGCNPSSPFPNSRECPLTLAAEKGFTELTQVLISRNANMECRTKKGCTPFYLTCKEGYQGIAVMLVKHGANTEATDQRGITPLLAAFRNGHVEVVDWLLGHVAHLPSDLDCQKALLAPKLTDKEVFPNRSKCLELIMKAKKAREQAALKNAQSLFEELDAEKEKEEIKRKAAARRRHKRKEKKKNKQFEKNAELDTDPKEFEEEEEEEFTGRPTLLQPSSVETILEREEAPPTSPTPTRKLSKKRGKKNQGSDSGLATPTLGSTTSVTRTSLQTPAAASSHVQSTDSWGEEEESGDDEMFVDAPSEFLPDGGRGGGSNAAPSSPKNCNGSTDSGYRKVGSGSGKSARDQKVESSSDVRPSPSLLPRSNKNGKRSKSLKDETKGGGGGGGVKRSGSQKVTKSEGGGGDLSVSSSIDGTTGAAAQQPHTRSPREKKKKPGGGGGGGGKKSPDPPPPTTTNDKKRSESAWRESPVLVREEDNWDNDLEPSLDWSNDNQQPFIPNTCSKVNRTKSWSSVTTATPSVSSATNSALPSSTANSSSGGSINNSKNWQEVSRAIKTHQLTVSNSLVGRIIGLKGAKINQIQGESGAQISISRAIPRSVERLVTIKGTERSVVTAREMIEEALSTSNRDSDELSLPNQSSAPSLPSPLVQNPAPPPLQSAPPLLATPPQITGSSTAPGASVSSPWGQPSLSSTNTTISSSVASSSSNNPSTTTTVWGQKSFKRYSDVVPPTSSSLQLSSTSDNNTETETPPVSTSVSTRKLSLPASIPSSSAPTSLVTPLPTTASQSKSATSLTKETPPAEPVVMVTTRTGSIPNSFLSIVQEEEENEEALKLKRSNSEPTNSVSFINPSSSGIVSSASSSTKTMPPQSLHPSQKFSPSMSPILSPSTPPPPSPLSSVKVSTAPVSSSPPEAPQSPEAKTVVMTTTTPSSVGVSRANRMVGVVTPTQTVKPYQHEATPTQTLPSSSTITVTPSSGSHGNFGAIGPPNRRNSLPVSPHMNNHYESNDFNIRKFSYAGIPMVPPVGGSLGVVHESFPIIQRDYNWPPPMLNGPLPPAPPPHHPPPPHPHGHPPNPSYVPPNHIDWAGGGGGNFSEQERVRSQSWAGLPPGNFGLPGGTHDFPLPSGTGGANRSYFDGNDHMSHGPPPSQHSPGWGGKSFHPPHHHQAPPPPPPHRSHLYQFRPPPSYGPHPLRSTSGNYSNPGSNYYEHGNGLQTDSYHTWAPPPLSGYHQSHKSQQSGSEPISLKQVLGEKLEQEIFPGEGGSAGLSSADFSSKDDSCSPSKRWSVSSFPPQVSSALPPPISNGTSSSSGWGTGGGGGGGGHPSARHSVTVSPFQDGGDSVICDLTSSWPTGIWSSPVPTSRQPQSPFSPSSSLPVRPPEDGWGVGGTGAQSDLVELMKSLDIAEHIPALKNRKLSLEQLCNLSEEGWRELNLPVGPRVKLMNAISNNSKPLEAK